MARGMEIHPSASRDVEYPRQSRTYTCEIGRKLTRGEVALWGPSKTNSGDTIACSWPTRGPSLAQPLTAPTAINCPDNQTRQHTREGTNVNITKLLHFHPDAYDVLRFHQKSSTGCKKKAFVYYRNL